MHIELKRLAHSELNLLRVLRNADRKSFFDTRPISVARQQRWWQQIQNSTAQFYTIWLNGVTPVGFLSVRTLRFIRAYGHWFDIREVGNLLLAPAHRGHGIMTLALIELRRLHNPLTFWVAHVKSTNTASLRLFERAGFWQTNGEPSCPKSQSSSTPTPRITGRDSPGSAAS